MTAYIAAVLSDLRPGDLFRFSIEASPFEALTVTLTQGSSTEVRFKPFSSLLLAAPRSRDAAEAAALSTALEHDGRRFTLDGPSELPIQRSTKEQS